MHRLLLLAQYDELEEYTRLTPEEQAAVLGIVAVVGLIALAVVVVLVASYWGIFKKAGEPGWAAIVPIYNWLVLLRIIKRPLWMIVLFVVSGGIIGHILASVDLAKAFDKTTGFAVGLILLPFVFYPMLAFGSATYNAERFEGRTY
jgi:hypothetical protein